MWEDFKTLLVRWGGPVVEIRFNTPETGNAVDERVLDELLAVLHRVHDEPDVRVVLLTGAGEHFCSGGDRHEFGRLIAEDPTGASVRVLGGKARRVCEALSTCPAVTIARVHGQVLGAGVALALFCDLRAGADDCRFRLPELALGLPAAWGGALPRLIHEGGAANIRELILTGDSFDAERAREMSVLHRVVPEPELDAVLNQWIRPIVRRSALALRTTKALLNSYAATARLADATLLEDDLLAAALAASQHARTSPGGAQGGRS